MADDMLGDRIKKKPRPSAERVINRAASLRKEQETDDPMAQANEMLSESDARTSDPAVADLHDDRLERRTSDEATPPPDSE